MTDNDNEKLVNTEVFISSSLRFGVYLSAVVIALGLILFFVTGTSGYAEATFPTSVAAVMSGLTQLKPAALISFGLFLLIATPVFRVAASVGLFLLQKDYLYTVMTLFVLVILLMSFAFGKAL